MVRKDTRNWLDSAEYDLESARHMLSSRRYLYVVFLCHLALEKALKAVVAEVTGMPAPKSHELLSLVKRAGVAPQPRDAEFLGDLDDASIPTRYPEDIREAIKVYTRERAMGYLQRSEDIVAWIRSHPSLTE